MGSQFKDVHDARMAVAGFLEDRLGAGARASHACAATDDRAPTLVQRETRQSVAAPGSPADGAAGRLAESVGGVRHLSRRLLGRRRHYRDSSLVNLLTALVDTLEIRETELERCQRLMLDAAIEAHSDALTGLNNRAGWEMAVAREEERCQRYGYPLAVLLVDLDDLKATNDRAGHAEGDALLQRAARALQSCVRRPDVIARLGGDEFAILAVDCDPRLLDKLKDRVARALNDASVRASVGAAVRSDTLGIAGAMRQADRAMYREKRRRKGH